MQNEWVKGNREKVDYDDESLMKCVQTCIKEQYGRKYITLEQEERVFSKL